MDHKIRVAILDDHPAIVEGYMSRLRSSPHIEVAGSADRGEDLEPLLAKTPVDVLLMDVIVPVSDTNTSTYPILSVIPRLIETYPDLSVLVVSMHSQSTFVRTVMEAGARGYVLKDDRYFLQDLPAIIESVAHGGVYLSSQVSQYLFKPSGKMPQLTPRQLQALSLCAAYPEASTTQLAEKMKVASSTLRNLLSGAYINLEVHSRPAAVAKAQQLGLISPTLLPFDLKKLGADPHPAPDQPPPNDE